MGKVLDTSVIVEIARGNEKVFKKVMSSGNLFYITSITRFEILVGFPKKEELFWISFLDTLEFDERSADIAAYIYRKLSKRGLKPSIKDLFIASICIANDIPLITTDKDFEIFKEFGLKVEILKI